MTRVRVINPLTVMVERPPEPERVVFEPDAAWRRDNDAVEGARYRREMRDEEWRPPWFEPRN